MYTTIHQCNAMSPCLHSNVCTRQYINAMQCPHVCIPMYVHDNTSMQCYVLVFAFQCMYTTIHQCNAMSSCLHSNVCTRQYINAMLCPHVCIPMYVHDNTSLQCYVLVFAFQCMYTTIHQCNAMSPCLHSNVCTRQYINAMLCPHVCIPMYVHDNTSMQCYVLVFAFQCVTGLV